jgi:hypothetical protein
MGFHLVTLLFYFIACLHAPFGTTCTMEWDATKVGLLDCIHKFGLGLSLKIYPLPHIIPCYSSLSMVI